MPSTIGKPWPSVVAARLPASLPVASVLDICALSEWEQLHLHGPATGPIPEELVITECLLREVSLSALSLNHARIRDVVFEQCDLSAVRLHDAVLTRVEFRNCRLSGVQMPMAGVRDVQFSDCKMDGANFRMSTLDRVRFRSCMLPSADFHASKCSMVAMFDCELTGADFSKAAARGTRLHGSVVDGLKGADALVGAVIDSTQVIPFALSLVAALRLEINDDRQDN